MLTPKRYSIHLEPDLESLEFIGRVALAIDLQEATERIELDAVDLEISRCSVVAGGKETDLRFTTTDKTLEVQFDRPLKGEVTLTVDYTGEINDLMAGFYRSRYTQDGRESFLAVTQFEERDARRAFPCVDHPAAKAPFDIEIVAPAGHVAISNTPVASVEEHSGGKQLYRFEQSPPMSTYLVFFGVGPFDVEIDESFRVPIRVAVSPGKGAYARDALEYARKSLSYLEEFTGVPYPLGKLDSIGVTDFAYGAMENFGAITYRENYLLTYPESTTRREVERMMGIAAHEIAHMWFGDLVSPADWRYIWLNEAFATFFGNIVADHWYPEWRTMDQFVQDATAGAMARDGLTRSVPIELPGDEEVEVDASTAPIIYSKGASILRMIRGYYGDDAFRDGTRAFLEAHAYGAADTEQFLHVFGTAVDTASASTDRRSHGSSEAGGAAQLLRGWIMQPGVPLVRVGRTKSGIRLSAERFGYGEGEQSGSRWMIPVTGTTSTPGEELRVIVESDSLDVDLADPSGWVKANRDQAGYYRVLYEEDSDWDALGAASARLSPLDRYGLVNDMSAFVLAGTVRLGRFLDFLETNFVGESEFVVLSEIARDLVAYFDLLGGSTRVAEVGRGILGPLASGLLSEPSASEPYSNVLLRDVVLWALFAFGDEQVKSTMAERFDRARNGGRIHPDVFPLAARVAAAVDPVSVDWIQGQIESESTPEGRKVRLLAALASVTDEATMKRLLEYSLEAVPHRNRLHFLRPVATNPSARSHLWPWFVEHFDVLKDIHPYHLGSTIAAVVPAGGLGREDEVRRYFDRYRSDHPRVSSGVIDVALDRLEINRRFLKREA